MIETNIQQEQHDRIFQELSRPGYEAEAVEETEPGITCSICGAVYTPSPQQALFLRHTRGAVEAAFMGMCHFCFRCRRAACPQCWDEMHGVCGSCVQEAGLSFRTGAMPLDGLMFPPAPTSRTSIPVVSQADPLFVTIRNGRFYNRNQGKAELAPTGILTERTPTSQQAISQPAAPDSHMTVENHVDTRTPIDEPAIKTDGSHSTDEGHGDPMTTGTTPAKTPLLEDAQGSHETEERPDISKKAGKASRLEVVLTWVVLVIVLALVMVIALAEFFPVVNVQVERVVHIDIHAEIAYLVHIVQQLFKR